MYRELENEGIKFPKLKDIFDPSAQGTGIKMTQTKIRDSKAAPGNATYISESLNLIDVCELFSSYLSFHRNNQRVLNFGEYDKDNISLKFYYKDIYLKLSYLRLRYKDMIFMSVYDLSEKLLLLSLEDKNKFKD